jgi:hypothetical protein
VFTLIGQPITESLIHDMVSRHLANGGDMNDLFVSGDYSAATDGLDIRASKVVLEEILDCLDAEDRVFRDFIGSILLEQNIIYPSWTKISPISQKNGQLMGSVLSFPILCLLNFYAYIMSLPNHLEIIHSKALMDRCAVLINGDDILFRTTPSAYATWLESIATVGFSPSVGKNFLHRRFFTVNSVPIEFVPAQSITSFWKGMSWADIEETPVPIFISTVPRISIRGFLNVGLLTGQSKLTGREALDALPLSGWHAGAVLEALNPSQAHKWFLKYHRESILDQTRFGSMTLNLFAHPLLGGLGFTVPDGVEARYSLEQRRLAQALFLSASYSYEGQEGDFKLNKLVFLETDLATSSSIMNGTLGRIDRKVEIEMYPVGTPLPEGYTPFVDETGIQPTVMSHFIFNDGTPLKAKCRLSSNRLKQLSRNYGDVVDLFPLDKMTEFPFTPVRATRSTFIYEDSGLPLTVPRAVEKPFSRVYCPDVPFQDVSSPSPDLDLVLPSSTVEDWETQDTVLVLTKPSPASSTPQFNPLRNHEGRRQIVLQKEARARNQGFHYRRTPLEEKYFE